MNCILDKSYLQIIEPQTKQRKIRLKGLNCCRSFSHKQQSLTARKPSRKRKNNRRSRKVTNLVVFLIIKANIRRISCLNSTEEKKEQEKQWKRMKLGFYMFGIFGVGFSGYSLFELAQPEYDAEGEPI